MSVDLNRDTSGQYGRLIIDGDARLAGGFSANWVFRHEPFEGQIFPAVIFTSRSSDFDSITIADPNLSSRYTTAALEVYRDDMFVELTTDPGDTLTSAHDLGAFDGGRTVISDIGADDSMDLFRLEASRISELIVRLENMTSNLNLYLYLDANDNGSLNSSEIIESSTNSSTNREVLFEELSTGVYYLAVIPANNAGPSDYRLLVTSEDREPTVSLDPGSTPAAAWDLGVLGAAPVALFDAVGSWDQYDVYRFEVNQVTRVDLALTGIGEDADLYLGVDIDADGVWDNGETIASSTSTGDDAVSEVLLPGAYFISVARQGFAFNTTYQLDVALEDLEQPTLEGDPGSTPASAWDLGVLDLTPVTLFDGVGSWDRYDFFRFEVDKVVRIDAALTEVGEDADLYLGVDIDTDGVWDSGETIASSTATGDDAVTEVLLPGTYFLAVARQGFAYNTTYRLEVVLDEIQQPTLEADPGSTPAAAWDLGVLSEPVTLFDAVGSWDQYDVYRLEADRVMRLDVALTGIGEDADLYLGVDIDGDGIWDSGETIASSTGNGDDQISEVLLPGVYYLEIARQGFAFNTTYQLDVASEELTQSTLEVDPGSAPASAWDLGIVEVTTLTISDSVGSWDRYDVYRLEAERLMQIDVSLVGIGEDADLYLGVDADGDGVWDNNETIEFSTGSGDDFISEALLPGVYFISVTRQSFSNNTTYSLEIVTTGLGNPTTAMDPGSTPATALDVGLLGDTPGHVL